MRLSAVGTFLGAHMDAVAGPTVHLHPGDLALIELQPS
jgi:hypothetical protein